MRRVVALDNDGAAREATVSGRAALPLPATRGLVVDSMDEFVGRLDMAGAVVRDDRSGVVRPGGVGEGLVLVLRDGGRA